MQQEVSARERILAAAKAEFLAKRYSEVSLRKICRDADITTGGFYRYFKDKEEVFAALVEPVVAKVDRLLLMRDVEESASEYHRVLSTGFLGDRFARYMRSIHEDEDILFLFLQNSTGTRYEHYDYKLADIYAQQMYHIFAVLHASGEGRAIDKEEILFFSRCFVDILVRLINTYNIPEQAEKMIRSAVRFWAVGFSELTGLTLR